MPYMAPADLCTAMTMHAGCHDACSEEKLIQLTSLRGMSLTEETAQGEKETAKEKSVHECVRASHLHASN